MKEHISTVLSVGRLVAVIVVAALMMPSTGQAIGSCVINPGTYCATSSSFDSRHKCESGQSGGCETCVVGNAEDYCFVAGGPHNYGYKTASDEQ